MTSSADPCRVLNDGVFQKIQTVKSQRWELIQDLFHQALARDEAVRAEFLLQRCQEDVTLLEEIQALLSCHDAPNQLWNQEKLTLGLKLLAMRDQLSINQEVGNYTLERIIGRGGMGDVYLGRDKRLGRHVALKFLPHNLSENVELSLRFHEEARAASSIAHANVAHIYELGSTDEREYIAMEFIDGITLRERIRRGPVELAEAVEIGEQVGRGIAAAHAAGVLHRDIKPENIMLGADGFVKVLDFGLAKSSGNGALADYQQSLDTRLTSPGVIMGTATYMSPEQFCGEETDLRTDIWSLGVTLYELISGRQPFYGRTYNELRTAVLLDEPLPLRTADDSARTSVNRIVARALRKKKEHRYASVEEFVNDLKRVKLTLNQDYNTTASWNDNATAPHPYPSTPLFQRTLQFAETGATAHAPRNERLLMFSIFSLMSLGFFGVLLASEEAAQLISQSIRMEDSDERFVSRCVYAAANLLGGFAAGKLAILLTTFRPVRYPLVVATLVLGYFFYFLNHHWMPSPITFVLYSLPYFGAAAAGAAIAFRPWSVLFDRERR